jgi:hypothetical protein
MSQMEDFSASIIFFAGFGFSERPGWQLGDNHF